jgi:two-component system LytT family response regulator
MIVDDDPAPRRIHNMLSADRQIEIVRECSNGKTREAVQLLSPDLVFLDVEMPGIDGFSVLEALAPERIPAIILLRRMTSTRSEHSKYMRWTIC